MALYVYVGEDEGYCWHVGKPFGFSDKGLQYNVDCDGHEYEYVIQHLPHLAKDGRIRTYQGVEAKYAV